MDPHHTARLLAIGRILLGTTLIAAPGVTTRVIGGERPSTMVVLLARTMGARDLALGIGAFTALANGRDATRWVRMGAMADAVDGGAVLLAGRGLGMARTTIGAAVAAAAAAAGARTATALEH